MEQNKLLFRILMMLSAVLTVGSIIFAMLLREPIGVRLLMAFTLLMTVAVVALITYYVAVNPSINRHYDLKREEGRLRWRRRPDYPDPKGYRFACSGWMTLFVALLGFGSVVGTRFPSVEPALKWVLLLLVLALIVVLAVYEKRLSKGL